MVAGDRRHYGHWFSDQVHDGILFVRDPGRIGADAGTSLSWKRMVLGRDGAGTDDLSAEPSVAGEAWIYLAALSATHPYAGCQPGAGQRISGPAILDLHESFFCAVVDRGTAGLFAGSTLSDVGVDVFDPSGALHGRQGTRLLLGRSVSDADGNGCGRGWPLGCLSVESAASGRGVGVLHGASGLRAVYECYRRSDSTQRRAEEFRSEE